MLCIYIPERYIVYTYCRILQMVFESPQFLHVHIFSVYMSEELKLVCIQQRAPCVKVFCSIEP